MNTRTCSFADGFALAIPITRSDLGFMLDGEILARTMDGVRARSGLPTIWCGLYCREALGRSFTAQDGKQCQALLELPDTPGFFMGLSYSERYDLYDGKPVMQEFFASGTPADGPILRTPWRYLRRGYFCLVDTHEEFTKVLPKELHFMPDPWDDAPIERQHVCSFRP